MNNCIFCQIVKGKIPCYKVYEDKNYFAFLDVFPKARGHTLLIPKKHYRWVYDAPDFAGYWKTALRLVKKLNKALGPKFITFTTHGLEVPHAHIHIIPRVNETAVWPESIKVSEKEMKEVAKRIKHVT
jgi:histidine triad (HIT) family protein